MKLQHLIPLVPFLASTASAAAPRYAPAGFPRTASPAQNGNSKSQSAAAPACNNFPELCSRPYDQIAHLGAHDSPFVGNDSNGFTDAANQYYDSVTQLRAGVRMLTAQVHHSAPSGGSGPQGWRLCHTSCDIYDAGPLTDWLSSIKTWMDGNPNEVVTILLVNSDDADAATLDSQFRPSGIQKYAYTPPSTTIRPKSWPTLQQLIDNNTRLITFIASLSPSTNTSPSTAYLLDEFTFVFENPFGVTSATGFTCAPDRPTGLTTTTTSGRMFLMNHFLDVEQGFGIVTPNTDLIGQTNSPRLGASAFGTQAAACFKVYGFKPTFSLVDYFNVGPALKTIDLLNQLDSQRAVGRLSLPSGPGHPPPLDGAASGIRAGSSSAMIALCVAVAAALLA